MRLPYFDAHCDTLSRCLHTGESLLKNSGQRAVAGADERSGALHRGG